MSDSATEQATPLTSELLTPPSAFDRPPTETRLQQLPFHELSWENFEKLCVRLAALEGKPEHCQRYGTAGQDQQGIDIYARVTGSRPFHAYQCKRYQALAASELRKAVQRFLDGSWKSRSSRLVFCTSAQIEPTQLAEEIESQRTRLNAEGLEFQPMGALQLSELLKKQSSIVDDFFGREWVKAFCGPAAALGLGDRLDGKELARLRTELRGFYRRIFRQHDPGVPARTRRDGPAPELEVRYVRPRILVSDNWTASIPESAPAGIADPEPTESSRWVPEPAIPDSRNEVAVGPIERTLGLEDWLESANRLLVVGPPGSGKSSLLRFLALDTLSEAPQLERFAQSHPGCIPIWVPFGFWTELFREQELNRCSLRSCLKAWLESHDAGDLYSLVGPALSDGRLVLLIDGIDEWRAPDLAGLAIQRLVEFIDRHGTPLICSSRPYGLERATGVDPSITAGVLTDLDQDMQKTLATIWFSHWLGEDDAEAVSAASETAQEFSSALALRPDLAFLARNPMLLVLLAQAWLYQQALPDNSFLAYERLVEHLHTDHPRMRANAASVRGAGTSLSSTERLSWLSFLAFWMQDNGTFEAPRETLRSELVARLCAEGFDASESRQIAGAVLGQASDAPAVLVNTSSTRVAFLHRGILEHLAARWILGLEFDAQLALVARHVADPRWSEVVLGVLQGARRDDRPRLVQQIQSSAEARPDSATPRVVLAAVAFGSFGLSPQLARSLASSTLTYVDCGSSAALRRSLASAAVNGLRSDRAGSLTREYIAQWFPSGGAYPSSVYSALGSLEPGDDLRSALLRALNDDEPSAQRAAAEAVSRVFAGEPAMFERLVDIVSNPVRPTTQAAALHALSVGWSESAKVGDLAERAVESPSALVRLVGHGIRTSRGTHKRDDAGDLVQMVSREGPGLEFGWKDLALGLLAKNWTDSKLLFDLVREGIGCSHERVLWDEEAWTLAADLPPNDERVSHVIVAALREPKGYTPHNDWFWRCVAKYRDNADVTSAVEAWAANEQWFDNRVYAAVCAFPTEVMKQLAFEAARKREHFYFWPLHALANGWSLNDPEVRNLALEFADGSSLEAAYVAPFLRQLRSDEDARRHLLRLLADPTCSRRDFVMRAIVADPDWIDRMQVAEAFLSVELPLRREFGSGRELLISLGVHHPLLLELVKEAADRRGEMLGPVIQGYGNHPDFRSGLITAAVPGSGLVRRAVVEELARCSLNMPGSDIVLARWRDEEDAITRAAAVSAYAKRQGASDSVLLSELLEEATCYGPDHQERRAAAFCGLLLLEKLELLNDKRESIGEPTPVRISVARGTYKINPVTTRTLAQCWGYVNEVWSDNLLERLDGQARQTSRDELEFFAEMADWVEVDTPFGAHIVRLIETADSARLPKLLGFMSRALPGSPVLLDQCLHLLGVRGTHPSNDMTVHARAAEILAIQFANDAVLDELLRSAGDSFPSPGLLVAMCKGWPEDEWLTRTYARAVAEEARSSEIGVFELRCARAPANVIEAQVRELVDTREPRNPQLRRSLLPALIRRTQRDADVAERMVAMMLNGSGDLSVQMAGARVFATSLGPSDDVRTWCARQLKLGGEASLWPTAFDVLSGRVRCVQDLVWDLLGTVT